MIADVLMRLFAFIMNIIAWVLPSWRLPNEVTDAFVLMGQSAVGFNELIPVLTLIWSITIIVQFELALIVIRHLGSLISYLRGGGQMDV